MLGPGRIDAKWRLALKWVTGRVVQRFVNEIGGQAHRGWGVTASTPLGGPPWLVS